jgi:hypothetical protein
LIKGRFINSGAATTAVLISIKGKPTAMDFHLRTGRFSVRRFVCFHHLPKEILKQIKEMAKILHTRMWPMLLYFFIVILSTPLVKDVVYGWPLL